MEEEQEGVLIENSNEEGIELPMVDDEEVVKQEDVATEENTEGSEEAEDFDKEALLKALNAERKQRKQLQKQLKENSKSETTKKSTYDTLIEQGVDKELAKTLSDAIDKPDDRVANLQFSNDLLRVAKKPGFEDIEEYAEEIRPFVDKGLTIEQAYYAATGELKKSSNTKSEIKRELEAKMKNQKIKSSILDIDTNSTATETKTKKVQYTGLELAAAKAAGMSIEEYKAFQKFSSVNDYENYKKSKSKK